VGGFVLGRKGDDEPAETAAAAVPARWSLCANPDLGFAVGYPAGWATAQTSRSGACLFFDPEPFTVPENTDFAGVGVEVLYAQQTYSDTVHGYTDPRFAEVLEREAATIAGRPAMRLDTEATGAGLYDRGTRLYAYVVDRGGRAFVVQTASLPGRAFERRKDAVDGAVRLLRFTEPGPAPP
jgi:hypothetical protein